METSMKFACTMTLLLCAPLLAAQKPDAPSDTPEPGSTEAIAKATTETRFLSTWVASIPASNKVPSPEKFFGRIMGAPGELESSKKQQAYFRRLAEAPPRV